MPVEVRPDNSEISPPIPSVKPRLLLPEPPASKDAKVADASVRVLYQLRDRALRPASQSALAAGERYRSAVSRQTKPRLASTELLQPRDGQYRPHSLKTGSNFPAICRTRHSGYSL